MSIIPIEEAMLHLRAEPEDQQDVQLKLDAAEEKAMSYLQRRFYADDESLNEAVKTIENRINNAERKLKAEQAKGSSILSEYALDNYKLEMQQIRMIAKGLVINDAIKIACLLTLGDLYENREDSVTGTITADIPVSSRHWLTPYRVDMGV